MKKVLLKDIAIEHTDKINPESKRGFKYIGLEHIEKQTLRLSGIGDSEEVSSTKKKFQQGQILYGSLRPYFRKVYLPDSEGICSTDITVLSPKEGTDLNYLFYLVSSKNFIDKASLSANGTKMPRAGWKIVKNMKLNILEDENEQRKVGTLIRKYDLLIENNIRRIEILEEMAQRLYTEWFVNFRFPGHEDVKMVDSGTEYGMIPEGWEVKPLGKLVKIQKGKNITKKTVEPGNVPVVAGGLTPAYYHNVANTLAPVITISASGANAGFVNMYYQNIWASDCSFIDTKASKYVFYFYLFLKNKQLEINNMQKGAAQPHVYPKDLQKILGVKGSSKVFERFHNIVVNQFSEIRTLTEQIEKATHIRDILIENLITGKRLLKNE